MSARSVSTLSRWSAYCCVPSRLPPSCWSAASSFFQASGSWQQRSTSCSTSSVRWCCRWSVPWPCCSPADCDGGGRVGGSRVGGGRLGAALSVAGCSVAEATAAGGACGGVGPCAGAGCGGRGRTEGCW
eukprot:scaffold95978_cov69-Phaeocystis_antarctica.AAC.1